MTGDRWLVSGAAGFLGRAVLREMRGEVVAVLRGRDATERAASLARRVDVHVEGVAGDVTQDGWGCADALGGERGRVAGVLHLAADTGWASSTRSLFESNVRGAENAVHVAAALGVPLVHVSTLFVGYGIDGVVPQRLIEDRPLLSRYERSKCRGEWHVADAAARLGVPTRIVRVGALAGDLRPGPGQRRSNAPLQRLLAQVQGSWRVFAREARIDVLPRDLVARRIVELLERPIGAVVDVVHVALGDEAPSVGALLHQGATHLRAVEGRSTTLVPVPAAWLLHASALADRLGDSPRAAALIGLRYLASPSIYESTDEWHLSMGDLLQALGLPSEGAAAPSSFYEAWLR